MNRVGLVLLLVLLPVSVLVAAPPKGARAAAPKAAPTAEEESTQAARDIAKAGTKLFAMKKYKDALDVFLKSHEVHPLPEVVWNIARCYEEVGDVENAIVFFEESAATDQDPKNRAEARARADKLKAANLGVLALETEPAEGVALELDGKPAGTSPIEPRSLRKGVHEVRLTREGYSPVSKSLEIVPGMKNSFRFELEALKAMLALDTAAPVAQVEVRLDDLVHGVFDLPTTLDVPPGTHRVAIKGLTDYEDLDRSITLAAGETTHLELAKRKSPMAAAAGAPLVAAGAAGVTPGADGAAAVGGGAGGAGPSTGLGAGDSAAADGTGDAGKAVEPETEASEEPKPRRSRRDSWRDSWYINLLAGYTWGGFKGSDQGVSVSKSFSSLFDGFSGNVPLTMRLGLGGTLSENFLLGVDFDTFFETGKQDLTDFGASGDLKLTLMLFNVNAMATWFPFGDGLYAKFGAGFSRGSFKIESDVFDSSADSNGYGLALGTGFALGFGSGFHLIFDLQYGKQWFNDEGLDGTWTLALCGGLGWY